MPTRTFTIDELADLGVPPGSADDIEYSDTILADEPVTILKYSQLRRCVFAADDGTTWAVEYETRIDMGDYEVDESGPDDHGWHGETVEAIAVEEREVIITKWLPVGAAE